MAHLAFSTVACPEWTLDRVAKAAAYHGYHAVELRSQGPGGADFACEPGMTSAEKVRAVFSGAGVGIAGLGTGVRFDQPLWPPVIGHALGMRDGSVDDAKMFVELAAEIGAPFVRVFAFDPPERTKLGMREARKRILKRLAQAGDAARNTGVKILLENGGAFPKGADIASLLETIGSQDILACYSNAAATLAGESPMDGVGALGWRLACARVKDAKTVRGLPGALRPCALGAGILPCAEFVQAIAKSPARFLTYEWDGGWLEGKVPGLEDADTALDSAARKLIEWTGGGAVSRAPKRLAGAGV